LKQRNAVSPLLFNLALDYAIRRDHVNQDGLKLNGRKRTYYKIAITVGGKETVPEGDCTRRRLYQK
jgi:hypothetical protein